MAYLGKCPSRVLHLCLPTTFALHMRLHCCFPLLAFLATAVTLVFCFACPVDAAPVDSPPAQGATAPPADPLDLSLHQPSLGLNDSNAPWAQEFAQLKEEFWNAIDQMNASLRHDLVHRPVEANCATGTGLSADAWITSWCASSSPSTERHLLNVV